MAKGIIPIVKEKDIRLMENLLSAGYVEHKYAVRLQTVLNRAMGVPTNTGRNKAPKHNPSNKKIP
jgi:hypothetical protein